jgi:ATP-dependent Clp protease ATP-binding subunit ClpC
MAVSSKLDLIFDQADEIARVSKTEFSSVHILLSYFVVDSPARAILDGLNVHEGQLLCALNDLGTEPTDTVDQITEHAWKMLNESGGQELDGVWYLKALVTAKNALAYQLLENCEIRHEEITQACWIYTRARQLASPDADQRITGAFGSIELSETIFAHANAKGRSRGQLQARDNDIDDSERRSRSPGRRLSDQLDRGGSRRDRKPRSTRSDSRFTLDPKKSPILCKLATNLSERAALGELDSVIGRESEITEIIDILSKRKSNNPLLIGEAGVGKTALVEGVVNHLVVQELAEPSSHPQLVVQLDVGSLLAGTHLRGALSERLRGVQEEVKAADGQIYVFIDELHSLFGNQSDGGGDAANELKLALSRGDFPCIGATTVDEYREHIEPDAALARRFSTVMVEEPSAQETQTIVTGLISTYESHHKVDYEVESIQSAIRLGRRYLHEQRDPDRTLSILDWAGAVAKRSNTNVTENIIRKVIAKSAKIPLEHLTLDASERFLAIEQTLQSRILGQPQVAKVIGDTLVRNLAGFSGGRPIGSMLFVGPTGVGKTEVVKTLAELVFGSSDALTRFDMSEFAESHTVARLIGSPPGYVGHQEGGQLTEVVLRRPYQVILLDEIEKAHRDIWNLLLQVTDEGHLSDSRGRRVDFSNTLLIMTSNLGAQLMRPGRRGVGFAADVQDDASQTEAKVLAFAKDALPLEFWNRLDARLVFNPLDKDTIIKIASQLVEKSRLQIFAERNISYHVSTPALEWVVDHGGFDWELGARPLRGAIAKWLEIPVSEAILKGELKAGHVMEIELGDDELIYKTIVIVEEPTLKPDAIAPSL